MQVFLVFFDTCITVTSGDLVQPYFGRTIHYEPHAGFAEASAQQACLLQLVTHFFGAHLQSLATSLQQEVDFSSDLSDPNFNLALVTNTQKGLNRSRLEAIEALRDLMLGLRREQRIKF